MINGIAKETKSRYDSLHKGKWKPVISAWVRIYYIIVGLSIYWFIDHKLVIHTDNIAEFIGDVVKSVGGPAGLATIIAVVWSKRKGQKN